MNPLSRYLEDKRPFLDSVFRAVQDGLFLLDRDSTIVGTNRWVESKFAARLPLVGKKWRAVFLPGDLPCSPIEDVSLLEQRDPYVEIVPYPSTQCPTEWLEVSMTRLENGGGAVMGAVGHVKNVTKREQVLALLKDEVNRRRVLVEQSRDGIVIIDQTGKVFESNQKFAQMLGHSLEETHSLHVWDWDDQWTRDQLMERIRSIDETGDHFETRHRRKDGTVYDVEISTNATVCNDQKLIFCVCRDISERISEKKRFEEALRLTQFSFDKASIGILRAGEDARFLNANEKACKSLGYSCAELCTMSFGDIDSNLSAEERKAQWRLLCEKGSINYETMLRRKDGTVFPVDVTANLLEFQGSRYSISFVRDITEQKNEEKHKKMLETHLRQAQRMEALGALAGGIAHDFNNVLSSIYGFAELAQLRCAANTKLRHYIDEIYSASMRAKNLVQQILTFSRQGQSVKRTVDLGRVVNETMNLVRATFPATIELRQIIPSTLDDVYADETQINHVLMNLCTNALQAMQKEGGLLEVALVPVNIGTYDSSCYPVINPGKYLKLVVADTGHGMDREVLTRIFDPYFTTKKMAEGTGMGLSIVHAIVKDHGGSMKVYSRPGVGTTFQVFLPIAETPPDHSTKKSGIFSSDRGYILFVDDERRLVEIGNELLEGLGYLVETKNDPVEAIDAFRLNPNKYDLIITDMTMPKMTGDQLAREIRRFRPDIPIVLCTGFSPNLSTDMIRELGVSEVLMKPITLSHLSDTVRKILGDQE